MGKRGDSVGDSIELGGEGSNFLYAQKYPSLVVPPPKYVDGVHVRAVMKEEDFPVKIRVFSTGQILSVYGFSNDMMLYTSTFDEGHLTYSCQGAYNGELGKDFIYL